MADSIPLVVSLLCRYASVHEGKFTREDFVRWGASHGLSRRTAPQTVNNAIAEAINNRVIEQVQDLPEAVYCLFRKGRLAA